MNESNRADRLIAKLIELGCPLVDDGPLSEEEQAADCAIVEEEYRQEAAEATDPRHRAWALAQAEAERAQAAQLMCEERRHSTTVEPTDRGRPAVVRRTHGTHRRAGARIVRRSTRAGPGDDPHRPEGDDEPPRDPRLLLSDVEAYLSRLDPHLGAEREFVLGEVAYLGHEPETVGVALALLTSEGKARRGIGDADADVIWKVAA